MKAYLFGLMALLLGFSTASGRRPPAPSPGPPREDAHALAFMAPGILGTDEEPAALYEPVQDTICNQTEVGQKVGREDSRGVTLSVVISCKAKPRFSLLGVAPELGGKNLKCVTSRKEVRFERTANGRRDYRIIGPAPDQTCCEGKAALPIRDLIQVQQICN